MNRTKDRHKNRKKYKRLWVNGKTIREHRLLMENHIGRKLLPSENVHHIDGNTLNNDIENLQIIQHGEHSSLSNIENPTGAKLTPEDVTGIRKMCKDKIRRQLIARCFGVDLKTIYDIHYGISWKAI